MGVAQGRTRLLCWTDSGTRGLIRREISCFVGGILDSGSLWVGFLCLNSFCFVALEIIGWKLSDVGVWFGRTYARVVLGRNASSVCSVCLSVK